MDRILKIRTEVCFWQGPEDNPETYSLFNDEKGGYFIRHWKTREDGKRRSSKHILRPEEVDPILKALRSLTIPASPEHVFGCDGGHTELEVGGYWGKCVYRWWSVPPKGWEGLDELVERLISLAPTTKQAGAYYYHGD